MNPKFIILFILLISSVFSFSQTVNISGKALLNSLTDNSNIQIVFERIAPSLLLDTTYTNQDGNYQITIEAGIYNIRYYKGKFYRLATNEKLLYSDTALDPITLNAIKHLIKVPADISTIQSAIDQANKGDTVLISEGIYKEKLIIENKEIVLASEYILSNDTSIISKTILDGNLSYRVIQFKNVQSSNCQLIGLTIKNGVTSASDRDGGGIYCYNSNPTLKKLIVENNRAIDWYNGGGIACYSSSPQMIDLIIRNNKCGEEGGGIYLENNSNAKMSNLLIYNNSGYSGGGICCDQNSSPDIFNSEIFANEAYGGGGGISLKNSSKANIQNNFIHDNKANYCGGGIACVSSGAIINNVSVLNNFSNKGGGICLLVNSNPSITNSLVAFNSGKYGIENDMEYPSNPSISFCNFYGNAQQNFYNCNTFLGRNVTLNANKDSCDAWSNIQEDPKLSGANNSSYKITAASSCIDAGKNSFVNLNFDFENNVRILSGRNESNSIVDIGCMEYNLKVTGTDILLGQDNILLVYPNPFSSHITYHIDNVIQLRTIEIMDLNGKLIYSKDITSTVGTVNLESLCSGIYLFRIVSSDIVKTMKIIKK